MAQVEVWNGAISSELQYSVTKSTACGNEPSAFKQHSNKVRHAELMHASAANQF